MNIDTKPRILSDGASFGYLHCSLANLKNLPKNKKYQHISYAYPLQIAANVKRTHMNHRRYLFRIFFTEIEFAYGFGSTPLG